jgi:hypothetical protein
MNSNDARVTTLEEANTVQSGLISTLRTDMDSNDSRITVLESEVGQDLTHKISNLENANSVQSNLITDLRSDMDSNDSRITVLESEIGQDLTHKISNLESANSVQSNLIMDLRSDMDSNDARITVLTSDITSNASRVTLLENANIVQSDLLLNLRVDINSNNDRIHTVEGNISSLESANNVQSTLVNGIRLDTDSNAVRVSDLETNLIDNSYRINNISFNDVISVNNTTLGTLNLLNSNTGIIANGNVHAQNFIGDGTLLTGVAMNINLMDNSSRIDDITTDLIDNSQRIDTMSIDLTNNAHRIDQLFNTDLAVNSIIVGNLNTNLEDNSSRIDLLELDVADNSYRTDTLINHLEDNSFRISNVSLDLIDNSSRIDRVITDIIDNSSRIDIVSANIDNFVVTLDDIAGYGNVTSDVLQLTNTTTGLIATGNIEASKFIGDGTLLTGVALETDLIDNSSRIDSIITNLVDNSSKINTINLDLLDNSSRIVDLQTQVTSNANKISFISSTNDTTLITSSLDVTGNIFLRGNRFIVESETKLINDAIIGIANNNTVATTDVGILMQRPIANVALIHHGGTDRFTIGYTQDDLEATDITNDTTNEINVNILGKLYTQNDLIVGSSGSYYGDGTKLTGITLSSDFSDNVVRISELENANSVQTGLITNVISDIDSNANRINALISDVGDNSSRIDTLTADLANINVNPNLTDITEFGNITSTTLQLTHTTTGLVATGNIQASKFIGDGTKLTGLALENDFISNVTRIESLENANIVQSVLISDLHTDIISNTIRIESLENMNTIQSNLLTSLRVDVDSNVTRIESLENVDNIQSNLVIDLRTDVNSNIIRIESLENANIVQSTLLTTLREDIESNITRISDIENSVIVSNSHGITGGFATGDIIYASTENTLDKLSISIIEGDVLKVSSSGVPEWGPEKSSPWNITETGELYYNTAFIGIGTSNPLYRLDIHGTANVGALNTSSVTVDGNPLALETDLLDNSLRISTLDISLGGLSSRIVSVTADVLDNSSRIDTLSLELSDNSSRIDTVAADLIDNSSRLANLETANIGDILIATGTNVIGRLAIGDPGQVLKVTGDGTSVYWGDETGGNGVVSSHWTTVDTDEINFVGNVGISNTDPEHDLGIGSNLYVDDDGSNVLVVDGNVAAESLTLGAIGIVPSYPLSTVTDTGNTTPHTIEFTNPDKSLVTTGNVEVGGDVEISGNLNVNGISYGPGVTPRFYIKRTGNDYVSTSSNIVQFNSASIDSHNGFDTSTYTYTAQIAGTYFLTGDVLLRQTSNDNSTAESRVEIRVNGVRACASFGACQYNGNIPISVHGMVYLNAGDILDMYHTTVNNGDIYISSMYHGFSGYLLC